MSLKSHINSKITMMILLGLLLTTSEVFGQLKIESVYPTLGVMGQSLEVTIRGTGFDESTRVSMYIDVGHKKAIVGSVDTPGDARDITVVGDRAYVADANAGLQVIDINNPANPQILGSVDTPDVALSVAVAGDRAYVADYGSGLKVIDISDSKNPRILGSVDTLGSALGVAVVGERAYVADGYSGLQVIDISNSANPRVIKSVDTPGAAYGVAVVGDKAYVADGYSGLQVIDISNLANPQIIGSVDTPDHAWNVTIAGLRAYVADGSSGLQVIDISNPANPQIIGSVDTPGYASVAVVVGDTAYVTDWNTGIQIIDISNPANPQIIGSVDTPREAWGVTVTGERAYVADGYSGLQVIDISNPATPQIIGSIDTRDNALGVAIVGDKAYVADGYSGLQVIDMSNPANPQIIGSVDTPDHAWNLTIVKSRAYVADGSSGLQVIDISNPMSPQILGSINTPSNALGITVVGERAYVADDASGLQVIDISDPANPQILGSVDTPGNAIGIAVVGDRAYVADYDTGLQVIDITNPANPQILGSADTPGEAWGVTVAGEKAYVADYTSGLQVIDISNPANPQILGSVDTPDRAWSVAVVGDTAYVADWGSGIQVIDISNPANPQIIGSVDTPGAAYGVAVVGNNAYVADGSLGLTIVPVPVEVTPVTVNSPTSISVTLPSPQIPGHYTLKVFNETQNNELPGAVTFMTAGGYEVKGQNKAIIVAGRGPAGDALWVATQACANMAYIALLWQGYEKESIHYLSPETGVDADGDGLFNDIDGESTTANLSYAINVWANDATEVLLYMTDHGGTGTFALNGAKSPMEKIDVETLDAWVDDLQGTIPGRVIFVYDACQSGSFVSKLIPPPGKERIVIASTLEDQRAWFMNDGHLSFSFQFWASIYENANLYACYVMADEIMSKVRNDQTALIDVNGNGIPNEKQDQNLANNVMIGREWIAASLPPSIGEVELERSGPTAAVLRARNIDSLNPIVRVWAVITPPDFDTGLTDEPVIDMPTVDLSGPDQNGVYEGVYQNFNLWGTYGVTFYAEDTGKRYSLPKHITLTQDSGLDVFEEDDTYLSAKVINIGDPQAKRHNFHDQGDRDWVKFYAMAGESYEIKAENLQSRCDVVLELYDRDGTTQLRSQDDYGKGGTETLTWECPADGIYYVMVKGYNDKDFGSETGYELKVYCPTAPAYPGYIKGRITDARNDGVNEAVVMVNTDTVKCATITTPEGYYLLCLPAGTHTVTVEAEGFPPTSYSGITVNELSVTNLAPITLSKRGDMNKDNNVDLADLLIVLKVLSGQNTAGLIRDDYAASGADVNGDNKVGMQEAIHILQKLSGLR